MPTEYEKMIAGDFYKPSDPELSNLGLVRLVRILP